MTEHNISYSDAVTEIEQILQQLESGEMDVDELTGKVKRVSFLIKLCKTKLRSTEEEVNKILEEDLDTENTDQS